MAETYRDKPAPPGKEGAKAVPRDKTEAVPRDKAKAMPKEETYELIKKAQGGDKEAKTLLVEANTGLVMKAAGKFSSTEYETEDLIQTGYIGLLKAIDGFDPGFGVMFSTYAVPVILGEIKKSFREGGRVKLQRTLKGEIYNMKKTEESLSAKLGREPRLSELAEEMGVSAGRLLEISEASDVVSSIASLDNMDGGELIADRGAGSPEGRIESMMVRKEIENLEKTEKQVILLRYFRDMTQKDTGKILGISQVQVSRIEKKVIGRIRQKMSEK